MELEKEVERLLVAAARGAGGYCLKWVSPGTDGVPDRICIFPDGRIVFIELKRPKGGRASKQQLVWLQRLRSLGCDARIISNEEDIQLLIEEVNNG